MKHSWKLAIVSLLVMVLLVPLAFGCGGGGSKGVTITIGEVTDFTGPSAPACIPMHQALEDLVRYYNDEALIPGAKLRLVSYDTRTDPSRYTLGYDWCKERGAKVICAMVTGSAETIKPFAERDKIPVATPSYSEAAVEPPGWVFALCATYKGQVGTLLNWLSEQWDYSKGIPKLGYYDWDSPIALDVKAGIEDFCQAHPDKFDYVGSFIAPMGTTSAAGEVGELKDCDYVYATMFGGAVFIKDCRAAGYHTQFISDSGSFGFYAFMVQMDGWENLDGYISTMIAPFFDEENAATAFIKQVIDRYHPGKSPEDMGGAYFGAFFPLRSIFEIVRQAVEKVGPANFDGQAFYDEAVKFTFQLEGLPQYGFTDSDRVMEHECAIYKWSAAAKGMVKLTDYLPMIE